MNSNTYLKESARTAAGDYEAISKRIIPTNKVYIGQGDGGEEIVKIDSKMIDLLHSAIGMQTETSEFTDMLKKHIFYGRAIDKVNLKEEIGDLLFYVALALRGLDSSFEEVMERNIAKLKARYPDKFSEERAENRNLDLERKILEENSK